MLRLLTPPEFNICADFVYSLALDLTHSGYPIYCDGIKTKEDFIARAQKSLDSPSEDILLFLEDGQTEGWIAYEYQTEERYLHAHIYVRKNTEAALAEFMDFCREKHPGCDLDLGFPAENTAAASWLETAGVPCIERSWHFQFILDHYSPLPESPGVRRVTEENFGDFAAIHSTIDEDMYWNCRRVRDTLSQWDIYIVGKGSSAGELLMTNFGEGEHYEIFAAVFADGRFRPDSFQALMAAGLNAIHRAHGKYLTFFTDVDCPEGEVLRRMGFQFMGTYIGFRAHTNSKYT